VITYGEKRRDKPNRDFEKNVTGKKGRKRTHTKTKRTT